jgi:hypothetical protein
MTGTRLALLIVQIAGGLTLLPYPFMLLANVMSLAAPNQTWRGAIPFLLLTVYPAVWIGLWSLSWKSLAGGGALVAFALSIIPVIAGVAGIVAWNRSDRADESAERHRAREVRNEVEPLNPLLWTIMCTGTRNRAWGAEPVSAETAIEAIHAHPELVNVGMPGYGSPLNMALENLKRLLVDGRITEDRRGQINVIRALAAQGAKLQPRENTRLWRTWELRRALYDGPVTTATENPLVWRIVTHPNDPARIGPADQALLNKPTALHGSPMYASLLIESVPAFLELWKAGARLTAEEEHDPAAAQAFGDMLNKALIAP